MSCMRFPACNKEAIERDGAELVNQSCDEIVGKSDIGECAQTVISGGPPVR